MTKILKICLIFLCLLLLAQDRAKKTIVCTLPVLATLSKEIGGEKVEVIALSKPYQDPHRVSPTPILMKKASKADLLIQIGMQLELWADEVANSSGNPKIFRGAEGRIVTSIGIPKEEVPSVLSRAQGDIHPEGNPHIWLDPIRAGMIADHIAKALEGLMPDEKGYFQGRNKGFQERIQRALFGNKLIELVGAPKLSRLTLDGKLIEFLKETKVKGGPLIEHLGGWLKKAEPLRGIKAVEYHKVWIYLSKLFGIKLIATIEEKPGIAPGPKYQRKLIDRIKKEGVKLILVDNFYDPSLPKYIAKETGAKLVILPNQTGGEEGTETYFKLIDHILDRMLKAIKD